jgi:C-terminal processing protease CtpA/Prc
VNSQLKDNYRFIVKAMIRGGPAHKSGRIIKGDQLVEVAGTPFNKERLAFSSEGE